MTREIKKEVLADQDYTAEPDQRNKSTTDQSNRQLKFHGGGLTRLKNVVKWNLSNAELVRDGASPNLHGILKVTPEQYARARGAMEHDRKKRRLETVLEEAKARLSASPEQIEASEIAKRENQIIRVEGRLNELEAKRRSATRAKILSNGGEFLLNTALVAAPELAGSLLLSRGIHCDLRTLVGIESIASSLALLPVVSLASTQGKEDV